MRPTRGQFPSRGEGSQRDNVFRFRDGRLSNESNAYRPDASNKEHELASGKARLT